MGSCGLELATHNRQPTTRSPPLQLLPVPLWAPVFIPTPYFALARAVRRIRSTPPKAPRGPAQGPVETRARVASAAVPSRELPTFNGLYPSIVARQLSQ
jgi:hypothetical protein